MIITGNGIALEREEINGISVTGSKVILPFDSMDRVLPKAQRLIYDATNDRAVHIITGDRLRNKLFYPLMNKDKNGCRIVTYNSLSDEWDGRQIYGTNDDSVKVLSLLTNRAVMTTEMTVDHYSVTFLNQMENKISRIEVNFSVNEGKLYNLTCSGLEADKVITLSDRLYRIGYNVNLLEIAKRGFPLVSTTRITIARLNKERLNGIETADNALEKADRIMEELFGDILVKID